MDGVGKFYSENNEGMNVGQIFVAIDPTIIFSEEFYKNIDLYIDRIHSAEKCENEDVRYPGENKIRNLMKSKTCGIELTDYTVQELNEFLRKNGFDKRV